MRFIDLTVTGYSYYYYDISDGCIKYITMGMDQKTIINAAKVIGHINEIKGISWDKKIAADRPGAINICVAVKSNNEKEELAWFYGTNKFANVLGSRIDKIKQCDLPKIQYGSPQSNLIYINNQNNNLSNDYNQPNAPPNNYSNVNNYNQPQVLNNFANTGAGPNINIGYHINAVPNAYNKQPYSNYNNQPYNQQKYYNASSNVNTYSKYQNNVANNNANTAYNMYSQQQNNNYPSNQSNFGYNYNADNKTNNSVNNMQPYSHEMYNPSPPDYHDNDNLPTPPPYADEGQHTVR